MAAPGPDHLGGRPVTVGADQPEHLVAEHLVADGDPGRPVAERGDDP
jgi:hypothetical protein